ncbi:MAG: hypothetical protein JNM56_13745 [Planctomycetia bacterium]|nr:hypothetical protein [Planctomycetia bacterium]
MAAIPCSQCGYSAEVPAGFRGWLQCGKCGQPFRVGRSALAGPVVAMFFWLSLFGIVAGGAYLGAMYLKDRGQVAVVEPTDKAEPPSTQPVSPPPTVPAKDDAEAKRVAEEQAKLDAERRKKEEEDKQQRLDEERRERERKEQQAREEEEKRKKEEQAKLEMEKVLALKRNPALSTSLEEVETTPDKFAGKFFTIDRASIKVSGGVDRHRDLNRFTLGVTSERGKYYSRVPLSGLLISTGDKVGLELQKSLDASEDYYRFKLFGECRKWQKKGDTARSHPEIHVYKIEIYSRTGRLTKLLEE